ncbi:hypothetical protein Pst134EB_023514 [Puccinia striiformis f. sp. tritici]|nr:hypothetical protein Pst134EB_023514 [Puccinia striiformis f. sp. tritici]
MPAETDDPPNDIPSTPPNTTSSHNPPESTRRESSRLRTPMSRPGFIATQSDSRRALIPIVPKTRTVPPIPAADDMDDQDADQSDEAVNSNPLQGPTQVASQSGKAVIVDLAQDSNDDNAAAHSGRQVDKTKDKDGFDHASLYFWPLGEGPDQDASSKANWCRWCPNKFKAQPRSIYNLKCHRDGTYIKGSLRLACPGRSKAIAAGAHLPPTAAKVVSDKTAEQPAGAGNLIAYTTKGQFNNDTLNRLLVIWIVRHSLPWIRLEDSLLRISFDYAMHNSQLRSRTWAADVAHRLYLEQQAQVIQSIKEAGLMISLVSDVWTTKGSHKAFIGISCSYITKEWCYVSQHLVIKYVSWHHNGKYLATPFANVLIKHGLHNKVLAQTTNSGSNNFTMATSVASILRAYDSTDWDVKKNHNQCICHVIALILGAGLRALQLSKEMVRPEKADKYFPTLGRIDEAEEVASDNIVEVVDPVSEDEDVDPDDAESAVVEPGWEAMSDDEADDEADLQGIGFTLKKVDYICRRIASSPQKQAEWKLWASARKYTGRGVIGGYGIRWNIAYDSRSRAYEGRRVINQLLENETDKFAGKSPSGHFFKGYEVSSKEWEDVNSLNMVLKDFLEMTKRMEGDGPKLAMTIYEYLRLRDLLLKKEAAAASTPLEPMFPPMLKILDKYLNLAIKCDTVCMATFLHPAWRMILFTRKFEPKIFASIERLVARKFEEREALIKASEPEPPPPKKTNSDNEPTPGDSESENDEFDFYPQDSQTVDVNTEMERYNSGVFPMDRKGDLLGWWKAHTKDFPVMASLARDYLACAASSATVERTFSAAAGVCGTGRAGLAVRTIERCISSHMWLRNQVKLQGMFADCQAVIDANIKCAEFDKHKKQKQSERNKKKHKDASKK